MHPSENMTQVIGGKRYSVKTATLLASDEYWDGHNFERRGRNEFLYRTSKGAYFQVNLTMWQGERDTITPLTREEAMERWDQLPEKEIEYAEAFDVIVEEAGRPPIYDQPMKQTAIWLPDHMIAWLKAQPGTMSETMRRLIETAMQE